MANWTGYSLKRGTKSDKFKQYLKDRGIYFEPSENGDYIHFEVMNSDKDVDDYVEELLRQNLDDSKKNLKDMNADQIIDLIKEAGDKGRSWEWLQKRLPDTFLNLWGGSVYNMHRVFPIKEEWNDPNKDNKGVFFNKPKNLSEVIDWSIVDDINKLKESMNELYEKYGANNKYDLHKAIEYAYKEEDSISKRAQMKEDKDVAYKIESKLEKLASEKGLRRVFTYFDLEDLLNKNKVVTKKDLIKKVNGDYQNKNYKNSQREHLITDPDGKVITSLSQKVGKLTPEAETYIRKVLRETTTEDIENKREQRIGIKRGSNNDILYKWKEDYRRLESLIKDYKDLLEKGTFRRLDLNREHEELIYTGKGYLDYRGRYKENGGYERTGRTIPPTVTGPEEFKELTAILSKTFRATTVEGLRSSLEKALEVAKKLPEDNIKLKKAKQKIEDFISAKTQEIWIRRSGRTKKLPDRAYVKHTDKKYIYLFPGSMSLGDIKEANVYNLEYLGKNFFDGEMSYVIKGTKEDLEKYAEDYLGYILHPDYLYEEDDFAGDIV